METVTRNSSRKTKKTKPVVDVPKGGGDESRITEFMDQNRVSVTKFMKGEFDGVGKREIDEVLRECAECSVLTRSPKQGGCWEENTEVIEDALALCQKVKAAPVDDDQEEPEEVEEIEDLEDESGEEPGEEDGPEEVEEIDDLEGEVEDDEEEKDEVNEEADEDVEPVQASPRKKETKKAAKKTGTKTTKIAAKKKTQTKPDKKASEVKKTKPAKVEKKAVTSHSILTMSRFSEESLKDLKGLDLWLGTARLLKIQNKIRCQVQDMPEVVGHLFDVHNGKVKLIETAIDGKGEKSYGKRRLMNILGSIKAHLGLT